MDDKLLLTNVQRFSMHDGPGIRTTVFLKGCSVHCPWCANPENINCVIEKNISKNSSKEYGCFKSTDELYEILMRDKIYYDLDGGVTFSGGEPLLQIKKLVPLLERLKKNNINLCVETALFVKKELVLVAIKYFDLFYVDIKIMDTHSCAEVIGGDIELYKRNIELLFKSGGSFIMRMPLINGYTTSTENINSVIEFLYEYKIDRIELLCEHHLGEAKYRQLGKDIPQWKGLDNGQAESCQRLFEDAGITAIICKV